MGHCYPLDLRVRVAAFVAAGHSCRAAAQHFDVSESSAIKLVRRTRNLGSPAPARQAGRRDAASWHPMRLSDPDG
jgi:transposase